MKKGDVLHTIKGVQFNATAVATMSKTDFVKAYKKHPMVYDKENTYDALVAASKVVPSKKEKTADK